MAKNKDGNVSAIGIKAFKKYGPEGCTLWQLSQVEAAGLWSDLPESPHMVAPATVLPFTRSVHLKFECKLSGFVGLDKTIEIHATSACPAQLACLARHLSWFR